MSRRTKALEFAQEGYNITITSRHLDLTDPIRDYAMDKISKIERFTERLIDVSVVMDVQKLHHRVEIVLKCGNTKIVGSAITEDMYASIDQAVHRIKEQLLRYKSKLQDHHTRATQETDMMVNVIRRPQDEELLEVNEEIEDENRRRLEQRFRPHRVVGQEKLALKALTIDEAVMKMELSQDAFLLFIHETDRKLKVIYRRKDNNYGIIEPCQNL